MEEKAVPDSIYEAVIAYHENNLSDKQAEELIKWINEDKKNLLLFRETEKIWYASALLKKNEPDISKALDTVIKRIEYNDIRPFPAKKISICVSTLAKIAAAILIILLTGVGSLFVFRDSGEIMADKYYEAEAPNGSRSVITLADGSTIWLNSGTKLRYSADFGVEARELSLTGEAYFVVAENKQIPFRVKTSDLCITALGTSFNIKAYSEESTVETTLEKGEIRIERINVSKRESKLSSVVLQPNQKAVYTKTSGILSSSRREEKLSSEKIAEAPNIKKIEIKIDTLVDTKLTTSWKDSRWIFKSEKLKTLVPILERRYDVNVVFGDTIISSYKFTGILKEESLEQVLKALCFAAPIKYEVIQNRVILSEDSRQKNMYRKP